MIKKGKKIIFNLICIIAILLTSNGFTGIKVSAASSAQISVTYQVYDNVKKVFLPNVVDTQSYAGIFGNAIDCVYANLSQGNITYKVHQKGGGWLPEVTNRNDYAGIKGKPIDGLMIKTDTGRTIKYRVHLKSVNVWLPYVSGYNQNDANNGYAGTFGKDIDAIQMYVESAPVPGGSYKFPVPGYSYGTCQLNCQCDDHKNTGHKGVDISAPKGTRIIAANSGKVTILSTCTENYNKSGKCPCGKCGNAGNSLKIVGSDGYVTTYMHLTNFSVSNGQQVTAGQQIGTVGTTGWSTGAHLHFELRINGSLVNPPAYIK